MPIRVEIEGRGVVAEFPDGTDQKVIDAAIKRDYFSGKDTIPYAELRSMQPDTSGAPDVKVENIPRWAQENPELAGSLYALHKVMSPIAEGLGLVGGGAAGAGTAGPVGAIAGAGMGYAGAGRVKKIADIALGISKPETATEAFTQTGKDIVAGGVMEAGGQIVGKGVQYGAEKLLQPFAKQITPEMAETARIAQKEGVTLSPAEITQSKSLGLMEKALNFIPGSAGTIQRAELNQLVQLSNARERLLQQLSEGKGTPESVERVGLAIKDKVDKLIQQGEATKTKDVKQIADDLLRKIGSTDTYESLGMKTQELLSKKSAEAVAKKTALYREVGANVPEGELPIANLSNTANKFKTEIEKLPTQSGTLKSILNWVTGGAEMGGTVNVQGIETSVKDLPPQMQAFLKEQTQAATKDWKTLQGFRQQLNDLIRQEDLSIKMNNPNFKGQLTNEGRIYKELKKALDRDFEEIAKQSGGDALDKLKIANAFYKDEYAPVWKNKDIQRLVYSKPETVVDTIFRPNNITEIKTLKKAIGESGYEPLKQKFVSRIIENAERGEGGFSWDKVMSQLEKYRPEELAEMLGQREGRALLNAVTKGMNRESIPVTDKFLLGVIKKSTPETVMNMIFHPNNSGNINLVKMTVGKEAFNEAKTAFTAKLLKMSEYGAYRPVPSVRAVSAFDEPTLNAIYSSEERLALDNLMKLSRAASGAERLAGNPSGTAQSVITFQQGRAVLTNMAKGRPDIAGAIWFLPKALAKVYLSPAGRKYFTKGLDVPANTELGMNIATKLLSIAGKDALGDNETENGK